MSTAAVVLAAGAGSRFRGQSPKLRAPVQGRPMISWVLDAVAAAGLEDVIVVTGGIMLADLLPDDVCVVHNPRWARGQATSVQAGVAAAKRKGHTAIVVGLADQPFITPETWRAVAASTSPIAVANFDGDRRPPVRLAASVWPLLPTSGDEGARTLMQLRPELVCDVPCAGQPDDIDTVEDLLKWNS